MGVGREKTAFARRREILAESLSSSQNITNILPSINPTRRFSLCNTPPPPLFIHLYGNLDKTSLSFSLFLFLSIYLSIALDLYLSLSLSLFLFLYLFLSLFLSLSIYLYLYLFLSLSIYLSIYLSL